MAVVVLAGVGSFVTWGSPGGCGGSEPGGKAAPAPTLECSPQGPDQFTCDLTLDTTDTIAFQGTVNFPERNVTLLSVGCGNQEPCKKIGENHQFQSAATNQMLTFVSFSMANNLLPTEVNLHLVFSTSKVLDLQGLVTLGHLTMVNSSHETGSGNLGTAANAIMDADGCDCSLVFDLNDSGDLNVTDITMAVEEVTNDEADNFDITNDGASNVLDIIVGVDNIIGESCPDTCIEPAFISVWEVTDDDKTITLPLPEGNELFDYNFTVDWGDDSETSTVTSFDDPDREHFYSEAGTYTLTINGLMESIRFTWQTGQRDKIQSIPSLGKVGWKSFESAFTSCGNLTDVTGGVTSQVTTMAKMFQNSPLAEPHTRWWDTSSVTNMESMFWDADSANPNTSRSVNPTTTNVHARAATTSPMVTACSPTTVRETPASVHDTTGVTRSIAL